jgi:hypothetical protein
MTRRRGFSTPEGKDFLDMHMDANSRILSKCVLALTATAAIGLTTIAGATVLVEQPSVAGIANHVFVAHVTDGGLPTGRFYLQVEQQNPFTSSGNLVPTAWDAGSQTGFVPSSPITGQLGFRNAAGASTAQMENGVVGAYLNSRDLPTTQNNSKMMIAPVYRFPTGAAPVSFANAQSTLSAEMDIQIPVADGPDTYTTADFLFVGPGGVRVSLGVKIFHYGSTSAQVGSHYDSVDNVYMINIPIDTDKTYLTKAATSASTTGTPWEGWRHFQWTVSQPQFVAALKYLVAHNPAVKSTDPTQYVFEEFHLNAEFLYSPASAELGWSMRGLQIWD